MTKKRVTKSKVPTDQELMGKAIDWWHRVFPKSELRPSVHVSAVLRGKRTNQWGERDRQGKLTKNEGPYVLLRSHDGGMALPLHVLTVCGLFRWTGRQLVPVFVLDGHDDGFVCPEYRKAALAHDRTLIRRNRKRRIPANLLALYAGSSVAHNNVE